MRDNEQCSDGDTARDKTFFVGSKNCPVYLTITLKMKELDAYGWYLVHLPNHVN